MKNGRELIEQYENNINLIQKKHDGFIPTKQGIDVLIQIVNHFKSCKHCRRTFSTTGDIFDFVIAVSGRPSIDCWICNESK